MADLDRIVAGISCREVLADLSDMLDRELPAERMAILGRHVASCHVCESFGDRFARLVARLRAFPAGDDELSAEATARLHARLAGEYAARRE